MTHSPVVLGIDFGGTKIAAAVCDTDGRKIASGVAASRVPSAGGPATGGPTTRVAGVSRPATRGPGVSGQTAVAASRTEPATAAHATFDHGVRLARSLLAEHAPGRPLAAVGVSTFGIPFDDRVELAPAIDGWESLPLGRELAAAFPGTPVRMATDAKAAAHAEVRWGALAGYDPAIYLNLGTGLSAAIVAGGQVLTGSRGAAGEIGYSLRELADVGRAKAVRVPLEDMVSGQALQRRSAGLPGRQPGVRGAAGPATAADLFAASGDPAADALIAEFTDELAFHVVNLSIALDPARIAVGGGLTGAWERIRLRLQEALSAAAPYPPDLVLAHFPDEAPLLGAVALAIEALEALEALGTSSGTSTDPVISQSTGHYCTNGTNGAPVPAPTTSVTKG